ncbi:MAG: DUF4349 domain-containing protein [Clostridiaceae bacterium]|nr:DUF4349 domain-containing protein [Clostridiaceae bacterium]
MFKARKIVVYVLLIIMLAAVTAGCSSRQKAAEATAASAPRDQAVTDDGRNIMYGSSVTSVSDVEITGDRGNYNVSMEDRAVAPESGIEVEFSEQASGIVATGYDGKNPDLDILAQRKVIRNANLKLEVDEFYTAYGNLQSMITGIGFIQESNIHRDYYMFDGERRSRITGDITIRVDARHFDNILNDVKGLGEVIDDRIYSTDVTDQYVDTEGRLKILKIEYEYLEEYMRSLKDPDAIFKTRMRMTELQTEIERLTGTLNKWSDLVELSTIYIRLEEKYPDEMTKKNETYWDRLGNSVKNMLTGVVEALGNLVIFIIEAIPTLVVLGILFLIGLRIYRKHIKKKKALPPEEKKEE